ncbi:MAG: hypothetical protein JXB49_17415 [Bacteroidales bacterium]|nr:hypothetical protein [Bacteroidales bacterium]MBN2862175.1 hypothetical protein [Bacteroidales bacterium]
MAKKIVIPSKGIFIDAFAPALQKLIEEYNKAINPYLKKKLKEAINSVLRKFSDRYPEGVSVNAKKLAATYGVDLCDKLWTDKNICGKTGNKSNIVWEHTTPITELIDTLLKCQDIDCVKSILDEYSGVVWITREEDDCLISEGYRNERPGGWRRCYQECGIIVIECK